MTTTQTKQITVFAPAKLNLYLHVTGRREDGYHTLDSLVAFTDIGDEIKIAPAHDFSFHLEGPFAGHFSARDRDSSPNSGNLAVRAAWEMAEALRKKLDVHLTLKKNVPLESGIGGGSSDAAAVIWGLLSLWSVNRQAPFLDELMIGLGADIPACLTCMSRRMRGVGEILDDPVELPEMPLLLVNPGKGCSTKKVFSVFDGGFRDEIEGIPAFKKKDDLIEFLSLSQNDLTENARSLVPEILDVLGFLNSQAGVRLTRMTGSGASCFALFDKEEETIAAAAAVKLANPHWWVQTGWLGRPQRY